MVPDAIAPSRPTSGSSSIMEGTSSGATSVARRPSVRATIRVPHGSPATGGPASSRTSTPIRRITATRPVRPGLRFTPSRRTPGSPRRAPATRWAAAEEKSPGTSMSGSARRSTGPVTPTAPPSRSSATPAASSMRSVWSREGTGSCTHVVPSA